jgi:uncharacterized protein YdbL (DUF1318 family)
MNKILVTLFLSIALPLSAFAISLDQAKANGLVGEQLNGYLGAIQSSPSSEVTDLIKDINGKRKAMYQDIAKKNGTPLAAVEKLAADKAIDKTAKGNYIQNSNGAWIKK